MQVTYVNHYLTDNDVVKFARQSFSKSDKAYSEQANRSLIRYLARGMRQGEWDELVKQITEGTDEAEECIKYLRKVPTHWVPFGHPTITLRVSAPVPIRTQCFKHKIGFVESEESRRYIKTTPVIYVPDSFRSVAEDVKQGSGDTHPKSSYWRETYKHMTDEAVATYLKMLDDGICPEQARFVLPQGAEVNWVWTGSLYAYAQFYNARSDSHAQKEVQFIADSVNEIIEPLFPISWPALTHQD